MFDIFGKVFKFCHGRSKYHDLWHGRLGCRCVLNSFHIGLISELRTVQLCNTDIIHYTQNTKYKNMKAVLLEFRDYGYVCNCVVQGRILRIYLCGL